MASGLEQRIDRLETLNAISELRSRFCLCVARGDLAPIARLFTQELEFVGLPDARGARRTIHGRQALLAYLAAGLGRPNPALPLIASQVVEIDGEQAAGACAMPAANGEAARAYYYYDRFRRVEGRWLFAYRKLSPYRPFVGMAA